MSSLYKSQEGKKAIMKLYDSKLHDLNIKYDSKYIDTSYGKTHILITGNPQNPPCIIVHGSNACAPIALETYTNLKSQYQVFAVDVLAQPNKSAESRMSMKDLSYGKWMNEIIKTLELRQVTLAGFSFGGLVILKTLEDNENNIKEVFLTAPAYIVNGNPIKALFKIFIPMKKYIKTRNIKYLKKFLSELFSEPDDFAISYLSKVFLEFEMDFTPVPTISTKAARNIKTPIHLIGAGQDMMFPGKKMLKRASKIFPSLQEMVLLNDSKHVQNMKDNIKVEQMILGK